MDRNLKSYLEKNQINYKIYEHPAVFTVEQSKAIKEKIPGIHAKCLFLKDNNKNYYLICIQAEKRLDIKLIKEKFNLKELNFASPEELKKELNLYPGAVSIFGMIYSESVYLILDKEIWGADSAGFHPNVNTATIVLNHTDLEKYYNSLKSKKEIMKL